MSTFERRTSFSFVSHCKARSPECRIQLGIASTFQSCWNDNTSYFLFAYSICSFSYSLYLHNKHKLPMDPRYHDNDRIKVRYIFTTPNHLRQQDPQDILFQAFRHIPPPTAPPTSKLKPKPKTRSGQISAPPYSKPKQEPKTFGNESRSHHHSQPDSSKAIYDSLPWPTCSHSPRTVYEILITKVSVGCTVPSCKRNRPPAKQMLAAWLSVRCVRRKKRVSWAKEVEVFEFGHVE